MAAFLGPLIGLATGIGGSFLSKAGGGANPFSGLSPGVANASQGILGNVPNQLNEGNTGVGQGLGNINQSANFFKTILGGSQEATQKLLAPRTNTILSQYDNAAKTAANIAPRGGGKVSTLAQGQTDKAGAYGSLLGQALPGAAEGLAGVGKTQAGVGSNLLGETDQLENPLLRQQDQASARAAGNFAGLGQGLGKWLAGLLNNKGGSSGAGNGDFGGEVTG